jgi:hypothetical protein
MRAVLCVLAMSIAVPAALADRGGRSLSDCTAFGQEDKSDDTVQFSIHNGCSVPVDCAVSWKVVCAPESKKRRSTHAQSAKLALTDGGDAKAEATASVCKDDSWQIADVEWSCAPNKE